jgi:hypothetical protein
LTTQPLARISRAMTDAAISYLEASGAAAICIVRSETGCTLRTCLTGHNVGDYPVSGHAATSQNRRE